MEDTQAPQAQRIPGPVLFAAIMNFVNVALSGVLSVIALITLVFGNVMGVYDWVTRQVSQFAQSPNYSFGINFIFGVLLAVSFSFVLFFVFLGIGLLKGKKAAWFIQVALSVLGVFMFPIGTLVNGVILFFFFRPQIRDYFKV